MDLEKLNSRGRYDPRYGVVAGHREIYRVAARLAAHPRTLARRIDAVIDPGSRDPGTHSSAGTRLVQLACPLSLSLLFVSFAED